MWISPVGQLHLVGGMIRSADRKEFTFTVLAAWDMVTHSSVVEVVMVFGVGFVELCHEMTRRHGR